MSWRKASRKSVIGLDVISEIKANTKYEFYFVLTLIFYLSDKLTRQREGFRQFFTEKELEEIQESTKRDLAMKKEVFPYSGIITYSPPSLSLTLNREKSVKDNEVCQR